MYRNFIYVYTLFILIQLTVTSCSGKKDDQQIKYPEEITVNYNTVKNQNISNAKYLSDFADIETLVLSMPSQYPIDFPRTIHISENGNIYLTGAFIPYILVFNKNGEFLKKIGQEGRGPGEFSQPWFITTDLTGRLIVGDFEQRRVSIFDKEYNYSNGFTVSHMILQLIVTDSSQIIIHDYDRAARISKASIYVFNYKGKLIKKFGGATPGNLKLLNLPFMSEGPYLLLCNNILFEGEYPDYHIRKYNLKGNLLKEFGVSPKHWDSVLNADLKKIPPPQMFTPAAKKKLDEFYKDFNTRTKVSWMSCTKTGYIILFSETINKVKESMYISIYDIMGNCLNNHLKFNKPVLNNHRSFIFSYPMPTNDGICFVQSETTKSENKQNKKTGVEKINLMIYKF